ncbi:hypothetical protein B0H21DRAFT_712055 [Amylocystis lapponica]|nr:hypothetical protein B0H21DRAFT_712055 [Amylocystis lapponica]
MSLQLFPTPPSISPPGSPHHSQTGNLSEGQVDLSQSGDGERSSPSPASSPGDDNSLTAHHPRTGNKRAAEDLTQFAVSTSRRVRLKKSAEKELNLVAKFSAPQREIWTAAQILKLHDRLEEIQPAEAKWKIPQTLLDKIEHYTFTGLISPALPFYIKDSTPIKLIMGILEKHPAWGYTKEVKNDKSKADMVKLRVQVRLTDRRAVIKKAILLSLGPELQPRNNTASSKRVEAVRLDIVKLCTIIANEHSSTEAVVTVQMCARFAFLRHVFMQMLQKPELADASYWPLVDKQLDLLRGQYMDNPDGITCVLTMMLNNDWHDYGQPDIRDDLEAGAMPNAKQVVADSAAGGSFVDEDDH